MYPVSSKPLPEKLSGEVAIGLRGPRVFAVIFGGPDTTQQDRHQLPFVVHNTKVVCAVDCSDPNGYP
eukprot:XP_001706595.1 Hypothetical protein GL50803_10769 [Giardia lamblia ATCC 50803]